MNHKLILLRLIACVITISLPVLAGLHSVTVSSAQPTERMAVRANDAVPIEKMLDSDGTLNVAGFNGNLDPTGYAMQTGPNGEPRFIPSAKDGGDGGEKQPAQPPTSEPDSPGGYFTWDSRFTPIGTSKYVYAIAVNGPNLYVGGYFSIAGGVLANSIAYWNGSEWSALGSGVNGEVHALAYINGSLYVGGSFTQAGGLSANRIARWDGSAWHTLSTGMDGTVRAIAAYGTEIVAGGNFSTAGGTSVNNIAKWNGTAWSGLGPGLGVAVTESVNAISVSGTNLYAGGHFDAAGSTVVNNIARWDGTSWQGLNGGVDEGQYGGLNVRVNAIAVFGTDVYVGGFFGSAGGNTGYNSIARYSTSTGQWYTLGTGVPEEVTALVHSTVGYGLYVGGHFTSAGGVQARRVAMWSTSGGGWSMLGAGTDLAVRALGMTANGYLYVGGLFSQAGSLVAHSVARWSGSSWSALGDGKGINGTVNAVLVHTLGGTTYVYVGGGFQQVGSVQANNVARWDGTSWSALGSGANNGVDRAVHALARGAGSDIYVGGYFGRAGGIAASKVARWSSGTGWSALGGGTSGPVMALAYSNYDFNLYVGGTFSQVGGSLAANNIARWNSSSGWTVLKEGNTNNNGVNGEVRAIAISDANYKVYVGGSFTLAGGHPFNNLAGWGPNGTADSWFSIGSTNAPVNALLFFNDDLYVGGEFTSVQGVSANHVARRDMGNFQWYTLGSGQANGVNGEVNALAASGNTLYVGGDFTTAGGISTNNAAGFGTVWFSLGSNGLTDTDNLCRVHSLAAEGSTLYAGGIFTLAGGKPSMHFARRYFTLQPSW
jgi:cortical protein marker for cell polarity/beta-propeller uncharacterized protein DUF5122